MYRFQSRVASLLPRGVNPRSRVDSGSTQALLPFFFLITSIAAFGSSVNCANTTGDVSSIQSAINGGGTVTITGTCVIGSSTVNINNSVNITGTATLNSSAGAVFTIGAGLNNVSISGLTFVDGGILLEGSELSINNGITIVNNTFRDFTSENQLSGIDVYGILKGSVISGNTFRNFWIGGFSSTTKNPYDNNQSAPAITVYGGLTTTSITNNIFDEMMQDAVHIFWQGMTGNTGGFTGTNVSISYNTFTRVHRIALELQGTSNWPSGCPGGCANIIPVQGLAVKGNYVHLPAWEYWNTFAYSIVEAAAGSSDVIINNTALIEPTSVMDGVSTPAYGIETPSNTTGQLVQGNVLATGTPNLAGWSSDIQNYAPGSTTNQDINNLFCGPPSTNVVSGANIATNGAFTAMANAASAQCSAGLANGNSNITTAFTSANNQIFPSGGNGTWSVGVVSNLSVRYVQFFLNGATTPLVTQEIQDVNTNFPIDNKWLYHATLSTSSLAEGTHTLTATVTDVSGAVQSINQTFSTGSTPSAPSAGLTPSSLSFGTETEGVKTGSQTLTLSNPGTAALTISGVVISGANAADFGSISTCGTSLAAGASCTITVTFTPSIGSSETGTLTISDNAVGSPQRALLSGTGVAPASPVPTPISTTLPTNLPKGMILWLANDAGVISIKNQVSEWQDQSGNGNNAIQTNAANEPLLVAGNNQQNALRFDGVSSCLYISSLPIDGVTGMTVFLVSANSQDENAGYGSYSLLDWPETGSWGQTFFGSYQTSSHFRFGTLQTGNENSYQMPFTRTDSFGLSEWMHASTTDSMWFNGQAVASYTGKVQSIAGAGTSALLGQGNNVFYPGDVSEVIVYNRSLSAAERQQIEQYLMTKYHL